MMESSILLQRTSTGPDGTFGLLHLPNRAFYTLELPWSENETNKSCIPIGIYECHYTYSPAFRRNLYLLMDVPKRFGIRIHPANVHTDLNGCIALGERLGNINGVKAVLSSRSAVESFEKIMDKKPFTLEIVNGGTEIQIA